MKKLSGFFYRISTGWVVLAGLALFLIFTLLTLPVESGRMETYAPGLGNPDASLFNNGQKLMQWADAYGESGRNAFLTARWGFDLAFPLIYTFFYITTISYSIKKRFGSSQLLPMYNLIPLLGLIFDLAENTATSIVMAAYPRRAPLGLFLAPVVTPLKWFFVSISTLLLIIELLLWLYKHFIVCRKTN